MTVGPIERTDHCVLRNLQCVSQLLGALPDQDTQPILKLVHFITFASFEKSSMCKSITLKGSSRPRDAAYLKLVHETTFAKTDIKEAGICHKD